jgi:hypothetical protein
MKLLRDYICSRDVWGFGKCGKTGSESKILVKNLIVDWRIVLKSTWYSILRNSLSEPVQHVWYVLAAWS